MREMLTTQATALAIVFGTLAVSLASAAGLAAAWIALAG